MAQLTASRRTDLGPGFWPVAIVLTIVNVLMGIWIWTLDIDKYLATAAVQAENTDLLFKAMSVIGNAIFVYVTGYLIYFSIVWRRRKTDPPNAVGVQVHDNHSLELWWTLIPAGLMVALAAVSVYVWAGLQSNPSTALSLEAIGHQFYYEFRYPTLKQTVSSQVQPMTIPVGQPVTLYVTSADVIHSFWVPEFRLKADMVPGNVQPIRFTPTKVGSYRLICTEFCGANHSLMDAKVDVVSAADYSTWLTKQNTLQAADSAAGQTGGAAIALTHGDPGAGKVLFAQKCTACHNANADFEGKIVGPGLAHLIDNPKHPKLVTGDPPTAENIAKILKNGYSGPDESTGTEAPAIGAMPNAAGNGLNARNIADLTAYLESLK